MWEVYRAFCEVTGLGARALEGYNVPHTQFKPEVSVSYLLPCEHAAAHHAFPALIDCIPQYCELE